MTRRHPTHEELEPIETSSRDALCALQLERLRWSLQHAYDKVPHYRTKFEQAGVNPGDLKTLEDLAAFPFTTKQDLRETYPFGMFAVPMQEIVRLHASSGTTGKPTVVGYTKHDIDIWSQVMARSIRAAGGRAAIAAYRQAAVRRREQGTKISGRLVRGGAAADAARAGDDRRRYRGQS